MFLDSPLTIFALVCRHLVISHKLSFWQHIFIILIVVFESCGISWWQVIMQDLVISSRWREKTSMYFFWKLALSDKKAVWPDYKSERTSSIISIGAASGTWNSCWTKSIADNQIGCKTPFMIFNQLLHFKPYNLSQKTTSYPLGWFSGGDHYKNYPGSSISRPWRPAPWLRSKRGSYRRAPRNGVKLRPGMVTKWNSAGFLQSRIVVLMVSLDLRSAHLVCHSWRCPEVLWSTGLEATSKAIFSALEGCLFSSKKLVKGRPSD